MFRQVCAQNPVSDRAEFGGGGIFLPPPGLVISLHCLSLVTLTATAGTKSAEHAAYTGANQENNDPSQYEPNPDVGSTLTIHTSEPGLLVTVGNILHAVVVHHANFPPERSKEAINFILGIFKSSVDVILGVEEVSGG